MSDEKAPKTPRWPAFSEPATKGDLITGLILTQAMVGRMFGMLSVADKDAGARLQALNAYDEAFQEFNRMIDQLGGAASDE